MASPRGSAGGLAQPAFSDAENAGSSSRAAGLTGNGVDSDHIDIRPRGQGRNRATSISAAGSYGSMSQATPARSYVQRSYHSHSTTEIPQNTVDDIRADTAELASRAVEDGPIDATSPSPQRRRDDSASYLYLPDPLSSGRRRSAHTIHTETSRDRLRPEAIEEVSEPTTPAARSPSVSPRDRRNPVSDMRLPEQAIMTADSEEEDDFEAIEVRPAFGSQAHERTPLLKQPSAVAGAEGDHDLESLEAPSTGITGRIVRSVRNTRRKAQHVAYVAVHPKSWDRAAIYEAGMTPVRAVPAVILGLLLNVLDALSYGMILFPLGVPLFQGLGSDGISMFYVSCIVSQLVYSCGGSIFRGGVGSEMIEVVPFFHNMAFAIMDQIGEDKPRQVLATTILAYSISSVITGLAFYLLGSLKLGALIGFFPRHILIGCIGGVGFFLVVTGLEVSARLPGNLEYNLPTLKKLVSSDTVALWTIPLALAVVLLVTKRWIKFAYTDAAYFISIIAVFYIVVAAVPDLSIEDLRGKGWIFEAPESGQPWWHFYTLYDFAAVDWSALASTIPAMLALTFFGLLHVPINVPALALTTGEDNLDLDRELRAHGYSNAMSGLVGSIQNYLVYTNTVLFMRGGGDSRAAGVLLAIATFGILLVGPVIVGYIPIMVVGALIFFLGFDLLREALFDTWGKAGKLEYATIIIIVLVMGVYDFVVGIGVGIILACVSFVLQTSQISAVRGMVRGGVANSTVRRHPVQRHYLQEVGTQIYVMRLAGFLFFGTIVGVENEIRQILDDERFRDHPISFLVLDLSKVDGIDFSAAEAFTRINRIINRKDVRMLMCGFSLDSSIGKNLSNVGLLDEDDEIRFFDALNPALEFCENQMLRTFYQRRDAMLQNVETPSQHHVDIPKQEQSLSGFPLEAPYNSPRQGQMQRVATATLLEQQDPSVQKKYNRYKQPLQLIMQTFGLLSDQSEDFWQRLVPYLVREEWTMGQVLYEKDTTADGFYMVQTGMLKAKYRLPQGSFSEVIVAGATCGELPFFSETKRTSLTVAERDSVTWVLKHEAWEELQRQDSDVASEVLKMSLKLTSERMDTITKYMLLTGT